MWQQKNWELNRGARAAQVRRRACKSEQCAGFASVLIKEKRLQTFFDFGLSAAGGRRQRTKTAWKERTGSPREERFNSPQPLKLQIFNIILISKTICSGKIIGS